MTEDAARHAVSMDQVLMSVKKTFTDASPVPVDGVSKQAASETFLPDSVRAQQRRLATAQTRRTKLPPLPAVLRDRSQSDASSGPPSSRLYSDVPSMVAINAIHLPEPVAVEAVVPTYHWRSVRSQEETVAALPQSVDVDALAIPDQDWHSLKMELRSVVDEWIEYQKARRS